MKRSYKNCYIHIHIKRNPSMGIVIMDKSADANISAAPYFAFAPYFCGNITVVLPAGIAVSSTVTPANV